MVGRLIRNMFWSTATPKEPSVDQNTDNVDSPTVQLLSGEETLAERDQQPQRQLGQKITYAQNDLQRYGPEMIQIFKRADEKKRAKTELVAAQLKYSEACRAVEELRERTLAIFDSLAKSEHPDTSPQ